MTAELVVRPADPLDVDEARRLVAELEALPPGARVHVDVSAVREVHPAGLAFLAHGLGRGGRVTLDGLSRRQERLLAYLLGDARSPATRAADLDREPDARRDRGRVASPDDDRDRAIPLPARSRSPGATTGGTGASRSRS